VGAFHTSSVCLAFAPPDPSIPIPVVIAAPASSVDARRQARFA
jgi:hypothetical protein